MGAAGLNCGMEGTGTAGDPAAVRGGTSAREPAGSHGLRGVVPSVRE